MRTRFVAFVLTLLVIPAGLGAAQDPLIGTWKLNLAKSKYSPGPPPQSATVKYELYGENGMKVTADGTNPEGKRVVYGYSGGFDGKDAPVTGNENVDAASMKRINSHTTEYTYKKAGKVTAAGRRAVSKDGKTLTITTKGTNAKGQTVYSVALYDKQ
jgi:hypothetical protein